MSDSEILQTKTHSEPHNHHLEKNISRVVHDDEYIHFGNEKFLKSDLASAFGGTLNPGLAPVAQNNLANPAPLGLSAFALTTFVLSLINVQARGVTQPNIVVGLAFFYGGAAQFLAGMFEFGVANTYGGLAFGSYGAFWCSYAAILVDSFGIVSAYGTNTKELGYALGIFLVGWFIFTFFMMIMTIKSTLGMFVMFALLTITFLLLAIAEFNGMLAVKKAGGVFGLITAFLAWYNAYAGIANEQNSFFPVKQIMMPDLEKRD